MASLKQKTVNGLFWSFIDNSAKYGIQFIVGIILARLLSPKEFGLIGMLTIFISISQLFIDSGFSNALIRKKNCTQIDYSTVFYYNLIVGVFLFMVLFFSSGLISSFFNEPILKPMIKILGLGLIINCLTIIQRTILLKRIDLKLQTKISLIASLASGFISIVMAYLGYGVWSLVFKTISGFAINSLLLWIWNKWRPSLEFSTKSFHEMFSFGSKLLLTGIIDTTYKNIYFLIIGKYFSASELGFYTRAVHFKALPAENLTDIIQRVSYPVLALVQDSANELKSAYKKIIKSTMFLSFVMLLGMAAIAEPMIITLIGKKWSTCIIYLQLLCIVGMFYPLHAINLNMLKVKGRSDLFLKLEIIKKVLAIPIIVIGIFFGVKMMIYGMIVNTAIAFYLNSYYSGRLIGYSFLEQIKDILPSFLLALSVSVITFLLNTFLKINYLPKLIILCLLLFILTIAISELIKFESYVFIKKTLFEKLKLVKKNSNK